ncbi:MAG: DUF4912 domain-containing protein [Cyanobium sp.]|jgi:hypothetical protein
MTSKPDFFSKLAALPLRRLRDLARVMGIPRYSAQARDGLLQAIASKSPTDEAASVAELPEASVPAPAPSPVAAELTPAPTPATSLQVHPQDAQWAYCRWEISPTDREAALANNAGSLCLRLADITGMAEGDVYRQACLETVVEGAAGEWYLPVPVAGRVYRAELGLRTRTGWISLAFSAPIAMPAEASDSFGLDLVRPFSLEMIPAEAGDFDLSAPVGVHERIYQVASQGRRQLGLGSEAFQESGAAGEQAAGGQASGLGLWASGLTESGASGVAVRQRSFWLVADAELIVYGATEPSARLTVAGEEQALSGDGTFRFQMAFPDGHQNYPIRAVAADGVQNRSITLDFKRTTPEAVVNSREEAIPEWF